MLEGGKCINMHEAPGCGMQYLLTEMAAAGLTPDVMIIGTMINAYAENNQPRRAAAVMQTYIDAGGQVQCLPTCIA